jgi:predicted outer membrane repeat protein
MCSPSSTALFTGNTAEFGGAIDGDGSSAIQLRSCTISANHATNDGGGIEETTGTVYLENTIIAANTAADQGPDRSTMPASLLW